MLSRIRRRLVGETGQPTVAHGAIANLPLLSSDPSTIGIFLSSSDLGWNFERKRANFVTDKANVQHFISENSIFIPTPHLP